MQIIIFAKKIPTNDIIFIMNTEKMFDEVSSNYDFLNDLISLGLHKIVKQKALSELEFKNGDRILDLCTGTGDIAGFIKEKYPNIDVTGIDLSSKMLDIARKKHGNIDFIKCDASKLPFRDNEFDFIISTFGFRNIRDKKSAISEIKRVLKNEGYFLQMDFGKSKFMPVFDFIILFFSKIFSKNIDTYRYLIKSKNEFLSPLELKEEFTKEGFECIKIQNLLFGIISYQIFVKN